MLQEVVHQAEIGGAIGGRSHGQRLQLLGAAQQRCQPLLRCRAPGARPGACGGFYIYIHTHTVTQYVYIYRLVSSVYYIYMYMIYTTNSANLVRKNRTEVWDILGVSKGIHQIWGLKPETKSLEVQDNMVNRVV